MEQTKNGVDLHAGIYALCSASRTAKLEVLLQMNTFTISFILLLSAQRLIFVLGPDFTWFKVQEKRWKNNIIVLYDFFFTREKQIDIKNVFCRHFLAKKAKQTLNPVKMNA